MTRASSPGRGAAAVALAGLVLGAAACSPERHLLGLLRDAGDAPDSGGAGGYDAALDAAGGQVGADAAADLAELEAGPPPSVGELWGEFVLLTCEKMQLCCTDDEKLHNSLASSQAFCESQVTNVRKGLATIQADRIVASIDGGRAAYRPERIDACLARLRGLGCTDARASRELTCEEVIEALLPVGQPCATSSHHECVNGYCAAGTCADRKLDGAACYEDQECVSRYCSGRGGGGLCMSPVGRLDDLCAP